MGPDLVALSNLCSRVMLGLHWQRAALSGSCALGSQRRTGSIVKATPLTAEDEGACLEVLTGFSVRLFASEPIINKPINVSFDERGRLWVASTVGYPYAAQRTRDG